MNIFFLHIDPEQCAQMHVDKHVVKMITESVQILCSVHHVCGSADKNFKVPYKITHKNHPSCIWTRDSLSNYIYLTKLAMELCKEYTYRYNKIHKGHEYIEQLINNLPDLEDKGFTVPRQAMPEMYKYEKEDTTFEHVIESYHSYYFFEKQHIFKWKNRPTPKFITDLENMFN